MSFPFDIFCTAQMHVLLIIEQLAIAGGECFVCWLVLPFRERSNFIQLSKNISLYCIFNGRSYILFTISASGLFLKHS